MGVLDDLDCITGYRVWAKNVALVSKAVPRDALGDYETALSSLEHVDDADFSTARWHDQDVNSGEPIYENEAGVILKRSNFETQIDNPGGMRVSKLGARESTDSQTPADDLEAMSSTPASTLLDVSDPNRWRGSVTDIGEDKPFGYQRRYTHPPHPVRLTIYFFSVCLTGGIAGTL